jgi:PH domain
MAASSARPISKVEGHLYKRARGRTLFGIFGRPWALRRFELKCVYTHTKLKYYAETELKGEFQLDSLCVVTPCADTDGRPNCIEVRLSTGEVFTLAAQSKQDFDKWLALLKRATQEPGNADIVADSMCIRLLGREKEIYAFLIIQLSIGELDFPVEVEGSDVVLDSKEELIEKASTVLFGKDKDFLVREGDLRFLKIP